MPYIEDDPWGDGEWGDHEFSKKDSEDHDDPDKVPTPNHRHDIRVHPVLGLVIFVSAVLALGSWAAERSKDGPGIGVPDVGGAVSLGSPSAGEGLPTAGLFEADTCTVDATRTRQVDRHSDETTEDLIWRIGTDQGSVDLPLDCYNEATKAIHKLNPGLSYTSPTVILPQSIILNYKVK